MSPTSKAYWAGALVCGACLSLVQDALGKDSYVALTQAAWISEWITVPGALLALVLAGWLYWRAQEGEQAPRPGASRWALPHPELEDHGEPHTPSRRGYYVACFALLLAAVMGGGAGYLHAKHASAEAAGLFLLALAVAVLGAFAVPENRAGGGGDQ